MTVARLHPRIKPAGLLGFALKNKENLEMGWIIGVLAVAAWLTHIFTCFSQELWGFLIAGALFFPIGILHGMYLWVK
jgi:hypothetical protein